MTKKLYLRGFKLQPIVAVVDDDDGSIIDATLGEQVLQNAEAVLTFIAQSWPLVWQSQIDEIARQNADAAHNAEIDAKRQADLAKREARRTKPRATKRTNADNGATPKLSAVE